jgi:hypothetical protein
MTSRIVWSLVGLALLLSIDYGLRKQQAYECQRGDNVPCPTHLSILGYL